MMEMWMKIRPRRKRRGAVELLYEAGNARKTIRPIVSTLAIFSIMANKQSISPTSTYTKIHQTQPVKPRGDR
jgi:hypothetical protein